MKKLLLSAVQYLIVVSLLPLIISSCNQHAPTTNKSLAQEQKRNFLPPTNQYPDTIFTGESRPIEFEEFDLDTMPKPKIIPLSKNARKVKAYSNTYPVIPPKVRLVPKELKPVVLSEQGNPISSKISF